MTRFDLEDNIMKCWLITEEINCVIRSFDRGCSEDQKINMLVGLHDLYNQKFEDLFECYETLLKENRI